MQPQLCVKFLKLAASWARMLLRAQLPPLLAAAGFAV